MVGSSTKDVSGAGLIIETSQGEKQDHALKFMFKASNNEEEYEALLSGIELCYIAGADFVKAYSDSQLVVIQLNREYETKNETMVAYFR